MERVNIHRYGFTVFQIETMSVCNMMCKFCAYPGRADKGNTLPTQSVYSIIDSLETDDSFEYVCFSHFNEPLMDARIYDFIAYAKKRALPVLLITNGLLFRSKEVIKRLIDAGPDHIKISLQVLDAESFRESRGINSSFSEYKQGIAEFLKSTGGAASKVVIDLACNFLSGPGMIKSRLLGLECGDPSVYGSISDLREKMKAFLIELQDCGGRFTFDIGSFDRHIDKVRKDYLSQEEFFIDSNVSIKVKPFIYGKRLTEFYPLKNPARCFNRILGVLASGSVVPCCLAYGDALSMGDVTVDSLETILERSSDFLKKIHEGTDSPLLCRRCLGAPTKRGAVLKDIRNLFTSAIDRRSK